MPGAKRGDAAQQLAALRKRVRATCAEAVHCSELERRSLAARPAVQQIALGYWVGVRRLFHYSLFLTTSRTVLPKILVLDASSSFASQSVQPFSQAR